MNHPYWQQRLDRTKRTYSEIVGQAMAAGRLVGAMVWQMLIGAGQAIVNLLRTLGGLLVHLCVWCAACWREHVAGHFTVAVLGLCTTAIVIFLANMFLLPSERAGVWPSLATGTWAGLVIVQLIRRAMRRNQSHALSLTAMTGMATGAWIGMALVHHLTGLLPLYNLPLLVFTAMSLFIGYWVLHQ